MPRSATAALRSKVLASKDTVDRSSSMLEDARRRARRTCLEAFEKGASLSELASWYGTSYARMRENLTRARLEREGSKSRSA